MECDKFGLFQNLNESLHLCEAVENSTPKPTTGNKRHTNSLQEQSFSEDIDFQEQSFSEDIDFVAIFFVGMDSFNITIIHYLFESQEQ